MNEIMKKQICTEIANTSIAMLTLLKQLHDELNHGTDDTDTCLFCKPYIDQSIVNRNLVKKIMES